MTLEELSFLLRITYAALLAAPKEEYEKIDYLRSEIQDVMRQKENN